MASCQEDPSAPPVTLQSVKRVRRNPHNRLVTWSRKFASVARRFVGGWVFFQIAPFLLAMTGTVRGPSWSAIFLGCIVKLSHYPSSRLMAQFHRSEEHTSQLQSPDHLVS